MSEEGFPIVSVGVALHSQNAAAQISGLEADLGYWFFFLSSCWLFIIHNRLRVLFHSLFHWHGRVIHYSWFSKPKYSLFIFYLIRLFIIRLPPPNKSRVNEMSTFDDYLVNTSKTEHQAQTVSRAVASYVLSKYENKTFLRFTLNLLHQTLLCRQFQDVHPKRDIKI